LQTEVQSQHRQFDPENRRELGLFHDGKDSWCLSILSGIYKLYDESTGRGPFRHMLPLSLLLPPAGKYLHRFLMLSVESPVFCEWFLEV